MADGTRTTDLPNGPGQLIEFVTNVETVGGLIETRRTPIAEAAGAIAQASGVTGQTFIFVNKAQADANLAFAAFTQAWVYTDPDPTKNGVYQKQGASGSGSWLKISDLILTVHGPLRPGTITYGGAFAVTITGPVNDQRINFNLPGDFAYVADTYVFTDAQNNTPILNSMGGKMGRTLFTSAGTIILPANMTLGFATTLVQASDFSMSFSAGSGASITAPYGSVTSRTRGSPISLQVINNNGGLAAEWNVTGDII